MAFQVAAPKRLPALGNGKEVLVCLLHRCILARCAGRCRNCIYAVSYTREEVEGLVLAGILMPRVVEPKECR